MSGCSQLAAKSVVVRRPSSKNCRILTAICDEGGDNCLGLYGSWCTKQMVRSQEACAQGTRSFTCSTMCHQVIGKSGRPQACGTTTCCRDVKARRLTAACLLMQHRHPARHGDKRMHPGQSTPPSTALASSNVLQMKRSCFKGDGASLAQRAPCAVHATCAAPAHNQHATSMVEPVLLCSYPQYGC
jgi:hypothetical protein